MHPPRRNVPSFRGVAVWVVAATMATAGLAFAGQLGLAPASEIALVAEETPEPCEPSDQEEPATGEEPVASEVEPGTAEEEAQPAEEECEPEGSGPAEGEGTEPEGDGEEAPSEADAERVAACEEAAGLTPVEGTPEGEETSEAPVVEKTHGLEHSTEVLLQNCIKNPQSQGLLNALRHHAINRARHEAKAAAKAAKKAAKAAKIRKAAEGEGETQEEHHGGSHGKSKGKGKGKH